MSNNSPRELDIYKTTEIASDHLTEILSFLEENFKEFNFVVKKQGKSAHILIQEKNISNRGEFLRIITLEVFSKPKSYSLNLHHQIKGSENQEHIYEIKVKGNYELKTLKKNLEKLITGKNLIHRPKFYPF